MQKIDYKPKLELKNRHYVDAIKSNNKNALKEIYKINYPKVELLILKNNGTKEHAKDIFQDAFIAVWENIKQDKFQPKSESSINGYLYTIAKNKWMDYLRSKDYKKTVISSKFTDVEPANNTDFENNNDDFIKEQRLQNVMKTFKNLGASCKSLLTKFYFEKMSMKTIAKELQIDNASTRNKKYRCMQKLKELVLKLTTNNESK